MDDKLLRWCSVRRERYHLLWNLRARARGRCAASARKGRTYVGLFLFLVTLAFCNNMTGTSRRSATDARQEDS
ncbi:hypothetical protein KSZ_29050 [Dictyobacter formicarum]|uniref:Uncharacterized protein n=1 Tax=Dictyobacter formicarum TaxID=2778368 RepID=A0ABQ3VFG6_9CHLR|nr:hypothetical protein KSZ_29050 [Dictyobacter formicarum]